jgi:hypothetical protein
MNKLISFFIVSITLFGCGKDSGDSGTAAKSADKNKAVDVTTSALPALVGEFQGTAGDLVIRADGSYTLNRTQEISFRTGSESNPKRDLYPVCNTIEFGHVSISKSKSQKYISFVANQVDVISAHQASRGSLEYEAKEVCELYAAARKAEVLNQRFEMAAPGVISLQSWPSFSRGTYNNEPTYFSPILHSPFAIGELYGRAGKPIDVTSFLSKFLAAATTQQSNLALKVPPKYDFRFSPLSHRFSLINNFCGFETIFKAVVLFNSGEFKIYPADIVVIRDIDNSALKKQNLTQTSLDPSCEQVRTDSERSNLKEKGLQLSIHSWMSLRLYFGSINIEKIIPTDLASDDR